MSNETANATQITPTPIIYSSRDGNGITLSYEVTAVLVVLSIGALLFCLLVYLIRYVVASRRSSTSRNISRRPLPKPPAQYERIETMRVEISQQQRLIQRDSAYESPVPLNQRYCAEVELLPVAPSLPAEAFISATNSNDGYEVPLVRSKTLPSLIVSGIKNKTIKRVRFADTGSNRSSYKSISCDSIPDIIQGPVIVEENQEAGTFITSTTITIGSRRRTQSTCI